MTNTVTILFLRASPFLGSPEKLILSHLKYIAAHDCKYVVGAFNEQKDGGNDFLQALSHCGISCYALKEGPISFFSTLRKIIRMVHDQSIEIICTQDYKSDFFGLLAGRLLKIPIVAVFHGRTSESARMRLYESMDNLFLRCFDRVIAVSRESGKKLARIGVKPHRMRVIPNGINVELCTNEVFSDVRREFSMDESDPLVVFAGRLSKEKGLDVLMDAAASVVESFPNARFMILGMVGKRPSSGPAHVNLAWREMSFFPDSGGISRPSIPKWICVSSLRSLRECHLSFLKPSSTRSRLWLRAWGGSPS